MNHKRKLVKKVKTIKNLKIKCLDIYNQKTSFLKTLVDKNRIILNKVKSLHLRKKYHKKI